jgi:hypothetical protein
MLCLTRIRSASEKRTPAVERGSGLMSGLKSSGFDQNDVIA